MATAESLLTQETERLNKKFDHLQARRPKAPAIDQKRVVVNLTDTEIDDSTRAVLSIGLNFAAAPHKILIKDIIGGIEQAVRKVSHDVAEEIRNEVSTFLKKAKPPKANLKPSERSALRRFTRNKDITILPADKGNATVIMKTEDYRRKMLDLPDDAAYRILPRDPTESITKRTVELIKKSNIPEEFSRNLRPPAPAPPRMYGLLKIHKDGIPLRPIVSDIGSPTYNLARHLTGILAPHVGNCGHHVKNSADFVKILEGIYLNPSGIMISLDVVSLFTRVPLHEALSHLEKKFDANTVKLFHHALTSTYFTFDNCYYEQKDGVAMGSPLSPAIANFFMEDFEEHALNSAPLRPKYFYRYVDDTFVIWPHGVDTLKPFLDHMNSRHPSIRFTMESEKEGRLPLLDILVQRKEDGSLSHKLRDNLSSTESIKFDSLSLGPSTLRRLKNSSRWNALLYSREPTDASEEGRGKTGGARDVSLDMDGVDEVDGQGTSECYRCGQGEETSTGIAGMTEDLDG
ncbi:uncharacterized protein LOC124171127 [Ischnura elegans]|uniref:uncharacterized protein LOC124171127 n=1 Tax=Ischnura elegans TaxID=197161 RepID=UPI001ED89ED1|nr:uncharacterized protein LOC124171127 [Ischnura elegans]